LLSGEVIYPLPGVKISLLGLEIDYAPALLAETNQKGMAPFSLSGRADKIITSYAQSK